MCSKQQIISDCDQVKDRKSTRLNSSHTVISYAVFCLKKKKINKKNQIYKREKNIDSDENELLHKFTIRLDMKNKNIVHMRRDIDCQALRTYHVRQALA